MDNQEQCNVKVVKTKQGKKQYLNIIMTFLLILLMKMAFSGLVWHEVIGLGLYILFFLHHIYNFKYTLQVLKSFFSDKVKFTIKLGLVLDFLLFLVISGLIFTSLNISNILFQFKELDRFWPELSSIHTGLANSALILISLHIGLHWRQAMVHIKRFLKISKSSIFKKWSLRVIVIIISILGIYSFNEMGISKKISKSFENLLILSGKLLIDDDEFSFDYSNSIKVGALSFQIAESEEDDDDYDEEDEEDQDDYDEEDQEDDNKADGVTSSTPTNPDQNIDGLTSSSPSNPGQNVDGITSSSPTNPEQNIDGVTSSTIKNVLTQEKYQQFEEKSDYFFIFTEYLSIISLFATSAYYSQKLILKILQLK